MKDKLFANWQNEKELKNISIKIESTPKNEVLLLKKMGIYSLLYFYCQVIKLSFQSYAMIEVRPGFLVIELKWLDKYTHSLFFGLFTQRFNLISDCEIEQIENSTLAGMERECY